MMYDFIDDDRAGSSTARPPTLARYCDALGVPESGYYQHRTRRDHPTERENNDRELTQQIEVIYREHDGRYGTLRVTAELKRHGRRINRKHVVRIMRGRGLYALTPRKIRVTTRQNKSHRASPNRLNQNFVVSIRNQTWLSDITHIPTDEGPLFLITVLDLASRKVVGWSISETLEQDGVLRAIQQAVVREGLMPGRLFHSDRGSQYTSQATRDLLHKYQMVQSMSGTGNCYDNAPMESFFKTLKHELVHWKHYRTRKEAATSIIDYIENYYNSRRLHSSIGYQIPREWKPKAHNQH